jgi:CRISPR-associated exonuclease Cas4
VLHQGMNDYLKISKLNTVVFCQRRYFIEEILSDTQSNHHITEGQSIHERTRRQGEGQWVWSDRLEIVGVIDQVQQEDNTWVITEFKKGYLAEHSSDQVQLCALGMCYEERFGETLHYGYIFYHRTRRRLKIDFTAELRHEVEQAVATMRRIALEGVYPPITDNPNKCKGCSVKESCQPELLRSKHVYWQPQTLGGK